MTAKPRELPGLRVSVRDFGNGPCIATVSHGATIVLIASGSRTAHLTSCGESGILSREAAVPVLERIAELWNAAADEAAKGKK